MRRLFIIWNRAYKTQHVIAETPEEALTIATKSGHCRRGYRRFKDVTSPMEGAEQEVREDDDGMLDRALNYGKSGVAKLDVDKGWTIDGEPTWPKTPDESTPTD
jgi:hypothetical protein